MAIQEGERIPAATLKHKTAEGIEDIGSDQLFSGKKVVLFALPGAFTPTCSAKHLPGFVTLADEIKAKGVDTIACLSVNDAFVMDAWGRDQKVGDKVLMLADDMGLRSQRYAMIVDDGVVEKLTIDPPGTFEGSSAEAILAAL
jgi:peroxiredoxin